MRHRNLQYVSLLDDAPQKDVEGVLENNSLHRYWDRATVAINTIQHIYCYFLIYYWWNWHYIGQSILIIDSVLGFYYAILGVSISLRAFHLSCTLTNCCCFFSNIFGRIIKGLLLAIQPMLFIRIYYIQKRRALLYTVVFFNVIYGLIIYLILCCYLLPNNIAYKPGTMNEFLIIIYFLMYALTILSAYPLFHPLQSININCLLFKLCSFLLKVMIILFTLLLMMHVFFNNNHIKNELNILAYYIYEFYLIKFFEITPILSIWIFVYASGCGTFYLSWIYQQFSWFRRVSCCRLIFCGLCYFAVTVFLALIGVPLLILLVLIISGIRSWILMECYICNILESLVLSNSMGYKYTELNKIEDIDTSKYSTWKMIYDYLVHIDDNISFDQRLYILHYLYMKNKSESKQLLQGMECIMMKKPWNKSFVLQQNGILSLLVQHFLKYLVINTRRFRGVNKNADELHFYNFDSKEFKFKCKELHYILLEIIGLFIIIIFAISNIISVIICPIILFYLYFKCFTEKYSNDYSDYLMDYKLWMLISYMLLLIITSILFIEHCKLIKVWSKCQLLDMIKIRLDLIIGYDKNNGWNENQIQLYHNYVREYRMIFIMLQHFFGPLSFCIMQYLGMMDIDNSLHIKTMQECQSSKMYHIHRDSVEADCYLFDINDTI